MKEKWEHDKELKYVHFVSAGQQRFMLRGTHTNIYTFLRDVILYNWTQSSLDQMHTPTTACLAPCTL